MEQVEVKTKSKVETTDYTSPIFTFVLVLSSTFVFVFAFTLEREVGAW